MSQPGEQPQGGENNPAPEKRMEMMQRQMTMPKVLKMKTVKKQTMPAQTSHQIQMKKQKILNQRMTHPQITQTKAKRQIVTVMVGELRTEAPSMLNLTGEEQEITVTDSTVITKQSMGSGQGHLVGMENQTEKPRIVTVRRR